MARTIVATALAAFCALFFCFANGAIASEIPNLTGRVVDEAHVLKPGTIGKITEKLEAHEKTTGDQIVVVTVASLGGGSIEDYGIALGRGWHIGQKDRNNGVILIVAPNDRKMRIEVGYGLEDTLTDAASHSIIARVITPFFRRGDIDGGVAAGVDAILQTLTPAAAGEQAAASATESADEMTGLHALAVILFVIILPGLAISGVIQIIANRRWRNRTINQAPIDDYLGGNYGHRTTDRPAARNDVPPRSAHRPAPAADAAVIAAGADTKHKRRRDDDDTRSDSSDYYRSSWTSDSGSGSSGSDFSGGGGDFGGGGSSGSW